MSGMVSYYQGAERNANLRALEAQLRRAIEEAQLNAQQLGTLSVTVHAIAEGQEPTVKLTQDENGIHLELGIPEGKTGQPGEKGDAFTYDDFTPEQLESLRGPEGNPGRDGNTGQPGKDGVSPTVTTAPITGGTRVTITDASGTKTFDVMDGKDGAAGSGSGDMMASMYDPQGKRMDIFGYADGLLKLINAASVQFADGETWQQKYDAGEFKGEPGRDGNPGQPGADGQPGAKGDPGYTPQKYVDYWTADDKAEMINDVLAALPAAEGVSF